MKKSISKRRIKNKNKKSHEAIFRVISEKYEITKKVFGDGYFIFSFDPNTIAWFWLKEFPEWKFGIWLNEKGYYIFGEATILIDKFKPSASTLSKTNVNDFLLELDNIKENIGEWKEYNIQKNESQRLKDKEDKILEETLLKLNNFISKENEKFEKGLVKTFLELKDGNTKDFSISPRFTISEYVEEDYDFLETEESFERTAKLFKEMSQLMPYIGNYSNEEDDSDYLSIDNFLFEHRYLENPKDFLESEIFYNREKPITKFEDLVNKFKEEIKN